MSLRIEPVNRFNWEHCARLSLFDEQLKFIPSNLYTIAQSKYENLELYALYLDHIPIGMAAIGYFAKVYWISRIMIDKNYQKLGYGTSFLKLLLAKITNDRKSYEIRTAIHPENLHAQRLFKKEGFELLGQMEDGELIFHKWIHH
ncbi:MAG: GNAT family N-acetyltransferase [Candidatus Pacearchaeota archaeon]